MLRSRKKSAASRAAGEFLFEIDEEPREEAVSALGGVALLARALRSLDVPGSVGRHRHLKQRQRGLDEASYIESFVILQAVGGECLDDFQMLREDTALPSMLGHQMPSPEAAGSFGICSTTTTRSSRRDRPCCRAQAPTFRPGARRWKRGERSTRS